MVLLKEKSVTRNNLIANEERQSKANTKENKYNF